MPGVSADKKPLHYNKAYHYYRGIRYRINTCSGLPNKTETNGQSIEFTKIQLLRLQNRVRNFHQQCHRYSMGGVSCLKIELLMFESATDCKKTCQKLQSYFAKNELGYGETRDITNSFQISSVAPQPSTWPGITKFLEWQTWRVSINVVLPRYYRTYIFPNFSINTVTGPWSGSIFWMWAWKEALWLSELAVAVSRTWIAFNQRPNAQTSL